VGQPLAILLVGQPFARVYVVETIRAKVAVGTKAKLFIDGKDAARLSYIAEVLVDDKNAKLPAGLPVRAEFTE
jgi:HlyD family secretion protein